MSRERGRKIGQQTLSERVGLAGNDFPSRPGLRLVCFEGTLRDLIPCDQYHLVPPRRPLPPPPLPLPAECRSRNMVAPHWTREMWNIGKAEKAGVVVHGKGADNVAGYPFISDVKIQTCLEQEWSEVTLVQGRDSNMEVTGERSLGEILWENKRSINPSSHDPRCHGLITTPQTACTHHQHPSNRAFCGIPDVSVGISCNAGVNKRGPGTLGTALPPSVFDQTVTAVGGRSRLVIYEPFLLCDSVVTR